MSRKWQFSSISLCIKNISEYLTFYGKIFDRNQLVPFFILVEVKMKEQNKNMLILTSMNSSVIFGFR